MTRIFKRVIGAMMLGVVFGLASCDKGPVFDSSSKEGCLASIESIEKTLTESEKKEFNKALDYFQYLTEEDYSQIEKYRDNEEKMELMIVSVSLKNFQQLNGLTAAQIIEKHKTLSQSDFDEK